MAMLTLGERRALRAVEAGRVVRIYRANGNVFHAPGISANALWRLERAGYLKDGPATGALERRCVQELTAFGRSVAIGSR